MRRGKRSLTLPRRILPLKLLEARCHSFALTSVPLGAATLFLGLFALGNEKHLFSKRFGDPLSYNALVKASNQLLYGLALSSIYMHNDCEVW